MQSGEGTSASFPIVADKDDPDLNPCDYFLWGYLKSLVYASPAPTTIAELKARIKKEIRGINRDQDLLQRVYDNMLTRIQYILTKKGGRIEGEMS